MRKRTSDAPSTRHVIVVPPRRAARRRASRSGERRARRLRRFGRRSRRRVDDRLNRAGHDPGRPFVGVIVGRAGEHHQRRYRGNDVEHLVYGRGNLGSDEFASDEFSRRR